MAWKPIVKVVNDDKWYRNALCFASEAEAQRSASDLMDRWHAVTECSIEEVEGPATHSYIDGVLKHLTD